MRLRRARRLRRGAQGARGVTGDVARCALLIQATEERGDTVLCSCLSQYLAPARPRSIPSANRAGSSSEYFVALHSSPSAPGYSCMEIPIQPLCLAPAHGGEPFICARLA